MMQKLYAIYDVKTQVFFPPMGFHNDAHACREMRAWYAKPGSMVSQYPEDFDLYEVGTWDDSTALLVALVPSVLVAKGSALAPAKDVPGQQMIPFLKPPVE